MRYLILPTVMFLATPALAGPLTFEQALTRADEDAPSIAARAAQADAARSTAIAADRLPDPKLEVKLQDFPFTGPDAGKFNSDNFTMGVLGISQEVPNLAKRHARASRATADIGAADAEAAAERRRVRIAAGMAWIDLYFAERRLEILNQLEKRLDDLGVTAPARLASGTARPSEAIEPQRLKAELADRRSDRVAEIATARAKLTRWTGDPDPEVTGPPPDLSPDAAKLHAGLASLPALQVKDALVGQATADVRLAEAAKHPDWEVSGSIGNREPRYGNLFSLGVKIDLPLFAGKRQNPVIAAKASEMTRARLDRIDAERELVAALDTDLADHRMHHERFERAQTTLLPLARERAELDRASYAAGRIDLGTALQSAIGLAEAAIDLLDREADVARDGVRITLTYEGERP
ncbi:MULTISPECIES: TolC family protein [unclassified Sphingomonas]|jgi:cobalt-zinc-cadmium efflux system outer membrane protein|nr:MULTISPECIES: TolC family protein [unclassified Sphingomonas]